MQLVYWAWPRVQLADNIASVSNKNQCTGNCLHFVSKHNLGLKELDVYFKSQRIFSEDLCYAAAKREHIQRTIMARSYFHTLTVICGLKAKFARLMKTKYVVNVPIGALQEKHRLLNELDEFVKRSL